MRFGSGKEGAMHASRHGGLIALTLVTFLIPAVVNGTSLEPTVKAALSTDVAAAVERLTRPLEDVPLPPPPPIHSRP